MFDNELHDRNLEYARAGLLSAAAGYALLAKWDEFNRLIDAAKMVEHLQAAKVAA